MPKNRRTKNPYARAKWLALGSMAGLAILLNMALRDWIASLHLAVVIVFTLITLGFAVHTLLVAIVNRARRNGEDPLGYQDDFGLAA